jgi:hypothetical protein
LPFVGWSLFFLNYTFFPAAPGGGRPGGAGRAAAARLPGCAGQASVASVAGTAGGASLALAARLAVVASRAPFPAFAHRVTDHSAHASASSIQEAHHVAS